MKGKGNGMKWEGEEERRGEGRRSQGRKELRRMDGEG